MTIIWILLGLVALGALAFILLWVNAVRASVKRDLLLEKLIAPAMEAAQQNSTAAGELIARHAAEPATRNYLYGKLREIGRAERFPAEFRTLEKIAESDLVGWLMHPNELASAPAEIQLVRRVPVLENEKSGCCFLFRFRAAEEHWAAARGWMSGVAGPYWDGEEPAQAARDTFSELTPFERMSEQEHLEHLRQSLHKKGLVVPS